MVKLDKIVLASGNAGKIKEFNELLGPLNIEVIPQSAFNVTDIEETGLTFIENAILKARHAAEETGLPALADDSGLSVDALDGAPGIYSARYAGSPSNAKANIDKLLNNMKFVADDERQASFHCVLALMRSTLDPTPIICHGQWHGRLLKQPRGENGFGYDPIFFVESEDATAAELDAAVKNKISHRAIALQKLLAVIDETVST